MIKADDLTPLHLRWLVKSRAENQQAALRLFELFEAYSERLHTTEFSTSAQNLVAACFSLWRAAFLADKTGVRKAVFLDARAFLGKMLTDNAINYPQDRSAREWTFNFYMNNARDCMLNMTKYRQSVEPILSKQRKSPKGVPAPQRRWDRYQAAFDVAINCLENDLKKGTLNKGRVSK